MRLTWTLLILVSLRNISELHAGEPIINAVVSAALVEGPYQNLPAPDGLATLFGAQLSDSVYRATTLPLPYQLGSTSLTVCNTLVSPSVCEGAPLVYVSATQINFYFPDAVKFPGDYTPVTYTVQVGSYSATASQNIGPESPSIFQVGHDCNFDPTVGDTSPCGLSPTRLGPLQVARGAIVDQYGQIVTSLNPARVGQYYTIYLTGLGDELNTVVDLNIPMYLLQPTTVSAALLYVGESSFVGLQQINFSISSDAFAKPYGMYTVLYPCGDYRFEVPVLVTEGVGYNFGDTQIPFLIKNGDIACTVQ